MLLAGNSSLIYSLENGGNNETSVVPRLELQIMRFQALRGRATNAAPAMLTKLRASIGADFTEVKSVVLMITIAAADMSQPAARSPFCTTLKKARRSDAIVLAG
jgi:hypothetical protein